MTTEDKRHLLATLNRIKMINLEIEALKADREVLFKTAKSFVSSNRKLKIVQ